MILTFIMFHQYFSKYASVVPLKDKQYITIANAFQKMLDESNSKPNKI